MFIVIIILLYYDKVSPRTLLSLAIEAMENLSLKIKNIIVFALAWLSRIWQNNEVILCSTRMIQTLFILGTCEFVHHKNLMLF